MVFSYVDTYSILRSALHLGGAIANLWLWLPRVPEIYVGFCLHAIAMSLFLPCLFVTVGKVNLTEPKLGSLTPAKH